MSQLRKSLEYLLATCSLAGQTILLLVLFRIIEQRIASSTRAGDPKELRLERFTDALQDPSRLWSYFSSFHWSAKVVHLGCRDPPKPEYGGLYEEGGLCIRGGVHTGQG